MYCGCKLNNDVCFAIGDCCPNLRSLNLSGAIFLKDFAVKNIAEKCPHLIEIRLSGCELLTKLSMEYLTLKESLNLYELDRSWINNVVGPQTCRRIGKKFKELLGLTISHTQISDEACCIFIDAQVLPVWTSLSLPTYTTKRLVNFFQN